ncbi:MAG: hypothetical protein AMK71_08550 [Nitrospira bacterium SG8_35_4]|nr:MAG: hypothetical protein AMK71_08550 [Nitrospira bacterium SG8_35_4]
MNSQTYISDKDELFSSYEIITVMLMLVFTALLRFPTFFEPWGGDQGVYGYIANGILEGKVPYRDMYTNTGYGLYFAYAFFFKVFGNNMTALHIGDFIASLMTVIIVYFITKLLYGKECAVIAGIVAALFGSGQAFSGLVDMKGAWGTYWQLAQRETFMTPLLAGGIFLSVLADRHKRGYMYFFAGILAGMAAVFKVTAVLLIFILMVYIVLSELLSRDGQGIICAVYKIVLLTSGIIIINVPFVYYFWSHDSLYEMYKAVFVHTSIYAQLSRGNPLANAFFGNTYILNENVVLWVISCASMIYMMARERSRENCLIVAWTLGTLVMIWGQGKFFGYHFLLIIAPFSVLTGFGIKHFLKIMPTWKNSLSMAKRDMVQIFLWVLVFGNLFVFIWGHYDYYRWHYLYLSGKIDRNQYYDVFNEYPLHLYSFRADYEVANYLKKHAKPGASLRNVNGGGETVIHYLTGLKSSTRFTSTWYLFNKSLYENPLTDQLRDEFIEDTKKERPDFILLIYYSMDEFREEYAGDKYEDVTKLLDYIQTDYVEEKSFRDGRVLYRRI